MTTKSDIVLADKTDRQISAEIARLTSENARLRSRLTLTGHEANLLLYALDHYAKTDSMGRVTCAPYQLGYSIPELQDLRDRLMAAHDHK